MLRAQQFLPSVFFYWAGIQWAPRLADGVVQAKTGTPASALVESESVAAMVAATEFVADVAGSRVANAGNKTPHTHLVGWPHSENMSNLPMCRGSSRPRALGHPKVPMVPPVCSTTSLDNSIDNCARNRLIAAGPRAHKLPK